MIRKLALLFALIVILSVSVVAAQEADLPTLKVAVLPVLNTMPLFVAQEQGLFVEEGVNVEFVPVDSARDRQIALQTGTIDGANTDMVGVALLAAADAPIKIVRHDAFDGFPFFAIVTGKASGLTTLDELIAALKDNTAQIAISNNTIIEYLTTTMLASAGYDVQPDDYLEIAAIPVRLEQVAAGAVAAANLPEPLVTLVTGIQGGINLVDDTAIDFVPTVLAFRQAVLDEQPEAVAAFLRAYERAVDLINADPEAYRSTPVQVPDPVRPTFVVPQWLTARVPTAEETALVLDWMVSRGLLEAPLAYEDIVDGSFLPERPDAQPAPEATPESGG
jgi:NitT/TauT family transport system substrate-binding protein